jgi:hypothetical protein
MSPLLVSFCHIVIIISMESNGRLLEGKSLGLIGDTWGK